ncbi:N-acetyl-beta-hexosaminidase [Striga asiatica]|uniref:N-acetyl-beta-hexosaminidase n=1 Tax=Striga asiatica TaxID=4170 RepID=A0A5A7Q1X4_STRAF|nr:N-acetyl-beta-hexosaminidase [Striga asiatica]
MNPGHRWSITPFLHFASLLKLGDWKGKRRPLHLTCGTRDQDDQGHAISHKAKREEDHKIEFESGAGIPAIFLLVKRNSFLVTWTIEFSSVPHIALRKLPSKDREHSWHTDYIRSIRKQSSYSPLPLKRDSLVVVYPIALITVVDSGLCKSCPWAPVGFFKTGATFMEDDTLGDKHSTDGSQNMSLRVGDSSSQQDAGTPVSPIARSGQDAETESQDPYAVLRPNERPPPVLYQGIGPCSRPVRARPLLQRVLYHEYTKKRETTSRKNLLTYTVMEDESHENRGLETAHARARNGKIRTGILKIGLAAAIYRADKKYENVFTAPFNLTRGANWSKKLTKDGSVLRASDLCGYQWQIYASSQIPQGNSLPVIGGRPKSSGEGSPWRACDAKMQIKNDILVIRESGKAFWADSMWRKYVKGAHPMHVPYVYGSATWRRLVVKFKGSLPDP